MGKMLDRAITLDRRDREIRRLHRGGKGKSIAVLALQYGLTWERVRQIVRRDDPTRQQVG